MDTIKIYDIEWIVTSWVSRERMAADYPKTAASMAKQHIAAYLQVRRPGSRFERSVTEYEGGKLKLNR